MRVRWSDVGHTESPGDWIVQGQTVQVDYKNIEVWKKHPSAVFATTYARGAVGTGSGPRILLTSWEDPDDEDF
jgi:hypothetical protein